MAALPTLAPPVRLAGWSSATSSPLVFFLFGESAVVRARLRVFVVAADVGAGRIVPLLNFEGGGREASVSARVFGAMVVVVVGGWWLVAVVVVAKGKNWKKQQVQVRFRIRLNACHNNDKLLQHNNHHRFQTLLCNQMMLPSPSPSPSPPEIPKVYVYILPSHLLIH